jgi:predicted Zn-ribbon and HTH transcriptional regulator
MTTLSEIFRAFTPEYIDRFGDSIPKEHLKAINAINRCRTETAGVVVYECRDCGETFRVNRSCGNRHCPTCQNDKTTQWLERQLQRQLPGHHFMLTFTVPEDLRPTIRSHQRGCYAALFAASSSSIKLLVKDARLVGGDLPGFYGVLHTWGRTLEYHPHIHYVVVGGALSTSDDTWHPSRIDFFLPVRALSRIFRAKFRDEMVKAALLQEIPAQVWEQEWNVNCQAVGESHAVIKYLAPYVFKVAISNQRIVKVEDHKVFFRYRNTHSNRWRTMALDVMELMRRFLQHVLPVGFMKVRYYGFLNPNCKVSLDTIAALIELSYGFTIARPAVDLDPWKPPTCTKCGGTLKLRLIVLPGGILIRPG